MARRITQKTFDDVVKENVVDFSMSPAEARDETIQQFEAQGINLANIIKDLTINEDTGLPIITEAVDHLKAHVAGSAPLDSDGITEYLDNLTTECNKSVPHRVLAAQTGAHETLLSMVENDLKLGDSCNVQILLKLLKALCSLIKDQPDIFDPDTLVMAMKVFEGHKSNILICEVLRLISRACILHENNRQNIINADIVKYLKPLVTSDDTEIMKLLCLVIRNLILDDDVRVEFGKAHDHAKIIATDVLAELTGQLNKFTDHPTLQSDVILTIASLTVRNEYCLVVEEAGGLKSVLDAMKKHSNNVKLVREVFQLLRALAGNDIVKSRIIEQGAAPLITDVLCIHKANEPVAKSALMCISTLTLRSRENSAALCKCGISEEILETMRLHPTVIAVQRNAAWAIRNIVSRSRHFCDDFTKNGAEELLNVALAAHPSVAHDIKSALRDLNCDVELKEEWTGTSAFKMSNN